MKPGVETVKLSVIRGRIRTMSTHISDEAIEAAARALDPHTMGSGGLVSEKFKDATRAEARAALEAAAPYLLREAWFEGFSTGMEYGEWWAGSSATAPEPDNSNSNPYGGRA